MEWYPHQTLILYLRKCWQFPVTLQVKEIYKGRREQSRLLPKLVRMCQCQLMKFDLSSSLLYHNKIVAFFSLLSPIHISLFSRSRKLPKKGFSANESREEEKKGERNHKLPWTIYWYIMLNSLYYIKVSLCKIINQCNRWLWFSAMV